MPFRRWSCWLHVVALRQTFFAHVRKLLQRCQQLKTRLFRKSYPDIIIWTLLMQTIKLEVALLHRQTLIGWLIDSVCDSLQQNLHILGQSALFEVNVVKIRWSQQYASPLSPIYWYSRMFKLTNVFTDIIMKARDSSEAVREHAFVYNGPVNASGIL